MPADASDLSNFGFKKHANAIAGIAKIVGCERVILGGHDWGGAVVYRAAQWYPSLISHVFSVATPYTGPMDSFVSTEELVKGPLPQFGYQLQLGSEDQTVAKSVRGEQRVRKFLNGLYGGKVEGGGGFLTPETGVDLKVVEDGEVGMSPLLDEKVCIPFPLGFKCELE